MGAVEETPDFTPVDETPDPAPVEGTEIKPQIAGLPMEDASDAWMNDDVGIIDSDSEDETEEPEENKTASAPVEEKTVSVEGTPVPAPVQETPSPATVEETPVETSAPVFLTEVVDDSSATAKDVKEESEKEGKGGLVNVLKSFMAEEDK